jgi:hypothetical protein
MSEIFRDQAQTRNSMPGRDKTAMRRDRETKGSHSEVANLVKLQYTFRKRKWMIWRGSDE